MRAVLPGCVLRPWAPTDAPSIAAFANDPGVAGNLRDVFPHPYGIDDAHDFLARVVGQDPVLHHCIEVDGAAAGGCGVFPQTDVYRYSAEIGYWLARPYWGRGIVTGVVGAMTEYAFDQLGVVRVFAGVFDWNPASMRVLEKCGYEREGVQRRAVFKDGRFGDAVLYAKVRP